MDESLQYLIEARMHLDAIVDIPLADEFFESTDEIKAILEANEEHKEGALSSLTSLFNSLINKLKDMLSNISNWFQTALMSKEDKERFEEFKALAANNPKFANKKVTIKDFKEYERLYDDALEQLRKECKKDNPSLEIANKIIESLGINLKELASGATDAAKRVELSVTLDTALKIADRNRLCAKAINEAIKNEILSLEDISKQLGDKQAKKFAKKIDRLSRAGAIHRMMTNLLHRKDNTLRGIINEQKKTLLSFTNLDKKGKPVVTGGSVARGTAKNLKHVVAGAGGPKEAAVLAKDLAVSGAKYQYHKYKRKKFVKDTKQDMKDFKKFMK